MVQKPDQIRCKCLHCHQNHSTQFTLISVDFFQLGNIFCYWCILSIPRSWHCPFHSCQRNDIETGACIWSAWCTYDSEQWQWSALHESWLWVIYGRNWSKAPENNTTLAPNKFGSRKPLTKSIRRAAHTEIKDWKKSYTHFCWIIELLHTQQLDFHLQNSCSIDWSGQNCLKW